MNSEYSCFLISPFGNKSHQVKETQTGQYELLYSAIKEMVESYPDSKIKMVRADDIADVGGVEESFILALHEADIVVAEITTTSNPNIYYELGIRFALRRGVTIPMYQIGTELPADLKNVYGVQYDASNPKLSRDTLHKFIKQRLEKDVNDSPVFKLLTGIEVMSRQDVNALRAEVNRLSEELRQARANEKTEVAWSSAEELYKRGEIKRALEKFSIALNATPQNLQLLLRYGTLLSKDKNHEEAVKVLTRAVELNDQSGVKIPEPYTELGMAYKRWGKPQIALGWLRKAVAIDPHNADAQGIIGGAYKLNYNLDEAIEAYERGYEADSASTYCLLNAIILRLIRNKGGDSLKAKKLIKEADKLTSDKLSGADHWGLYDRGHVLLLKNKTEDALKVFDDALAKTLTEGDLDSARSNIDLLLDADSDVPGLNEIVERIDTRAKALRDVKR